MVEDDALGHGLFQHGVAALQALQVGHDRGPRGRRNAGVRALPLLTINSLVRQVAEFGPFTPDNDPYDQHDFGCIHIGSQRFFWKIDCYDKALEFGSPDPGDEAVTARVLTIMLGEEY